jgi:uncharacterized protein (DUF1800 family)
MQMVTVKFIAGCVGLLMAGITHAGSQSDWARFLDQATFGARPQDVDAWKQQGMDGWIKAQAALPATQYPNLTPYPQNSNTGCPGTGAAQTACLQQNYSMYPLQVQFFQNALSAPDQLRQKVAFALSEILVVSGVKVTQPSSVSPYLNVLVNGALGNFRDLLEQVTLNPAMGYYLDMVNSDPASANGVLKPNENYAREVLQLFSIGLYALKPDGTLVLDKKGQPIPSYSQDDIEGFAAAFTGWTYATQAGAKPQKHNPVNYQSPMEAYSVNGQDGNHDHSAKALLAYKGAVSQNLPANQTAVKDLSDALDNIFHHPNVGPFIGKQLIQFLVTSNPSPGYVSRVTAAFNNNGHGVRGDLLATVRAILMDKEARGSQPGSANFGKLREPALFLTAFLRATNATSDGILNNKISVMGQDIFNSPTVFNYYPRQYAVPGTNVQGPEFGIESSASTIQRANLINTLVYSKINSTGTGTSISLTPLESLAANQDPTTLFAYLNTYVLHGGLSREAATQIGSALSCSTTTSGTCSNAHARAQAALYLAATSALFQIQE